MTSASLADDQLRAPHALAGAVAGVLAGAVAIGAAQLAAGLTVPQSSPVLAVGQAAIDLTPLPVKNFAISAFGTHDKTVLLGGILVVLALYAAAVGMLAVRRLAFGMWGLALFAFIGLTAALTRPNSTPEYVVPTLAGAAAGAFALARLTRAARRLSPPPAPPRPASPEILTPPDLPAAPDVPARPAEPAAETPAYSFTYLPNPDDQGPPRWPERRRFLVASGVTAAAAATGTLAGRELITRRNVSQARAALRFPRPAVPAPPLPAGSDLHIPGLSSFITPNGSFYRVDTALLVPQVDPATWQLRIHGMVQREVTITFAELLKRPLIENYVTLTCVSDPVGGPYVGNARWLGASLAALIRQARPLAGASQLLCTSVDGFTSGTPLEVVLDGRDALLAVAMNGEALPVAHGFPARLVAAGADQDRVQDRRARRRRFAPPGADAGGRGGVGAAQGHRRRGGQGRRRPVASGTAGRGARHRHVAAVGLAVARDTGQPPARSPRHRPDRLHPDPGPGAATAQRRLRLPFRRRHRQQFLTSTGPSSLWLPLGGRGETEAR